MAHGAHPVAGGTDLVVGARQGKVPLPESLVAIHRVDELRGVTIAEDRVQLGALTTHEEIADPPGRRRAPYRARRCSGDRGLARHAGPGHDRRQPDERLARDGGRRSAHGPRRNGRLAVDGWPAPGRCRRALVRAGTDGRRAGRAPHGGRRAAPAGRDGELLRPVGVPAADGDRDRRRDGGRHLGGRARRLPRSSPSRRLRPTILLVPEAEEALVGTDGGPASAQAAAQAAAAASRPISDVRGSAEYRRAMAVVVSRRAVEAAVARAHGEAIPIPASRFLFGATRSPS